MSGLSWCDVSEEQLAQFARRFWERVDTSGDCWVWTAGRYQGRWDYGQVRFLGKMRIAHRAAWEFVYRLGPIGPGLVVMHACDNPPCVRHDHLSLGTQLDNSRDCAAKGRRRFAVGLHGGPAAVNAAKTHCIHGHEFTEANTRVDKCRAGVMRACRECGRLKQGRYRQRKAATAAHMKARAA